MAKIEVNRGIGRKGTIFGLNKTQFKMAGGVFVVAILLFLFTNSVIVLLIASGIGLGAIKALAARFGEHGINKFEAYKAQADNIRQKQTLKQWLTQSKK